MSTQPALRSPAPPTRVGDLLLPTILTLAGRGPVSAANFLTLLASPPNPQRPPATPATALLAQGPHHPSPSSGTRVTANLGPLPLRSEPCCSRQPTQAVTP